MDTSLGIIEARFADIVWANAPLSTRELVELCAQELNWKRTTTYTVLKKHCDRGLFEMKSRQITALISKAEFLALQGEQFVDRIFQGSLPAFIAAFTTRKKPTAEELAEIRQLLESFEAIK